MVLMVLTVLVVLMPLNGASISDGQTAGQCDSLVRKCFLCSSNSSVGFLSFLFSSH